MEPESTTQTSSQIPTASPKPKKDPFSMIGKIAIAIIIIVVLVGGGILLGRNMNKPVQTNEEPAQEEIDQTTDSTDAQANTPTTPEPTTTKLITLKGGLGTDATVFETYKITTPQGWMSEEEKTEVGSNFTLKKGNYSIQIYQAPMGGGFCVYQDQQEEAFETQYDSFNELTGANGEIYRRSWDKTNASQVTYTVCQKGQDESFNVHTIYGAISITTPNPADEKMLTEIDTIISSLEAQ